ncbi:MAG: ATPase, partial [Thiobacillaceae bacterium]
DVAAPSEIDLQYAVAAALAGRALRARGMPDAVRIWGHILDYAQKFPQREMGVMLVSDMHRGIGEKLFAVPQFAAWANAV